MKNLVSPQSTPIVSRADSTPMLPLPVSNSAEAGKVSPINSPNKLRRAASMPAQILLPRSPGGEQRRARAVSEPSSRDEAEHEREVQGSWPPLVRSQEFSFKPISREVKRERFRSLKRGGNGELSRGGTVDRITELDARLRKVLSIGAVASLVHNQPDWQLTGDTERALGAKIVILVQKLSSLRASKEEVSSAIDAVVNDVSNACHVYRKCCPERRLAKVIEAWITFAYSRLQNHSKAVVFCRLICGYLDQFVQERSANRIEKGHRQVREIADILSRLVDVALGIDGINIDQDVQKLSDSDFNEFSLGIDSRAEQIYAHLEVLESGMSTLREFDEEGAKVAGDLISAVWLFLYEVNSKTLIHPVFSEFIWANGWTKNPDGSRRMNRLMDLRLSGPKGKNIFRTLFGDWNMKHDKSTIPVLSRHPIRCILSKLVELDELAITEFLLKATGAERELIQNFSTACNPEAWLAKDHDDLGVQIDRRAITRLGKVVKSLLDSLDDRPGSDRV